MEYNESSYNEGELSPAIWQYQKTFHELQDFYITQIVFLKSNPDVPLIVYDHSYDTNEIICVYVVDKINRFVQFPPECILPYELACLVQTYDGRYKICLN